MTLKPLIYQITLSTTSAIQEGLLSGVSIETASVIETAIIETYRECHRDLQGMSL